MLGFFAYGTSQVMETQLPFSIEMIFYNSSVSVFFRYVNLCIFPQFYAIAVISRQPQL